MLSATSAAFHIAQVQWQIHARMVAIEHFIEELVVLDDGAHLQVPNEAVDKDWKREWSGEMRGCLDNHETLHRRPMAAIAAEKMSASGLKLAVSDTSGRKK